MALHNDIGKLGERLVAEHLRQIAPVTQGAVADLRLADLVEIEVKTAVPSRASKGNANPTYQFCIQRDGRKGLRAPVLVCVCLDPTSLDVVTFVIPAQEIEAAGLKKVRIPYRMGGALGGLAGCLARDCGGGGVIWIPNVRERKRR